MEVKKSDGSFEEFDVSKVKRGICEAFASIGEVCNDGLIEALIKNLFIYERIESFEIRRQVEEALMSVNKKVARAYIQKYDEEAGEHKRLKSNDDFVKNYIKASNAATGSKYDSNANVSNKNIVTLGQEIHKGDNIKQNRYIMHNKIKALYSKKLANQYIYDLENHIIYRHDESGTPGYPYCVAITMYPFLVDGLKNLGGQSKAPTDLKSFCGEFINLVYSVSSQFMGAVATPEFLMYMDYFIRKDYGDDYLAILDKQVELNRKGRTLEQVIENCFQQVVHSMNMPAGNRGYQTVFWNCSYFDKPYFNGVFGDFRFPDGTAPKWETLSWLQKKFMKWFNQEREKYILTFPVETMAMLTDGGDDFIDKEYADFTAEMWAEGHSFFCYLSDSPDSLSSCCFDKNQKVLWKSSTKGVNLTTLEELHNLKWEPEKKNLRIFHNGSWVKGKTIKLPNRDMYKVVTANNKEFLMTDNHINVTIEGEKETKDLKLGDYLMFNTQKLSAVPENDENLTYEQGFAVGAFLGDGSFGSLNKGTIYDINFSQNKDKYEETVKNVNIANKQLGCDGKCTLNGIYNNVYPIRISSKILAAFIMKWTNWERGTYAHNKKLNLNCLLQSEEFRKGILDGWYNTDGGNSNRCYTTSKELAEDMEVLITSLGMQSIIDVSDKTDEEIVIRGEHYNRNYPLYCVRWYTEVNNRVNKDQNKSWIKKNNSIFFKIKEISKIEYTDDVYCIECANADEPYFTLPCGLITHNCRLRNSLKDVEDEEHNHTTHQFSMGTASVATGSKCVITIDLNRAIQDATFKYYEDNGISYVKGEKLLDAITKRDVYPYIKEYLRQLTERVHKYLTAFNAIVKDFYQANMLTVYSAGFIDMKKQYLTIGVNGLTDAAEFFGLEITPNDDYVEFVNVILETINISNKKDRTRDCMFNTEFIPGENVSYKHYNWDKNDGYYVSPKHIMYSSYFFNPEDENVSILDKFVMHGRKFSSMCDGGMALHQNLQESLTKEQYKKLLKFAAKNGTSYFTFNVRNTYCEDCGYISKHTLKKCPHCGSANISYLTRIIGYLKKIKDFSEPRQIEASERVYN